jgi:hypothetical protein
MQFAEDKAFKRATQLRKIDRLAAEADKASVIGAPRRLACSLHRQQGGAHSLCPGTSDVDLRGGLKGAVDLDGETTHRALELGVIGEQLKTRENSGALVEQRRLRPMEEARALDRRIEPSALQPFIWSAARTARCASMPAARSRRHLTLFTPSSV